jgi:D-alanyl-D-alanine carboxypeptidase
MMTRKARALGMRNTVYVNPNGLPDDAQISTARDQALLGIAIQERFPQYYRYFSLPSFVYRGHAIRNHNHLLGSVEGVDGIKTGYTRDSGFNLVTSVRRGPRHIVAVVLGGRSASRRDARMRELIEENIAQASTKPQPVQVADAAKQAAAQTKPTTLASAERTPAVSAPPRAAETTSAIVPGSNAPLTPVRVKTVSVKLVPPKNAVAAAKAEPVQSAVVAQAVPAAPQVTEEAEASPDEALAQTLAAAAPIEPVQPQQHQQQQQAAPTPPPAARPGVLGHLPAMVAAAKEAAIPSAKADEIIPMHRTTTRGGWAIQIGAYEDEGEAKQKLSNAKGKISQMLRKAEAYIERTVKGAKTYYRARFAGLDREQAETACKRLKREDVACMALKI